MAGSRTFTVDHPDGTSSSTTTRIGRYPFAVVAAPRSLDAEVAALTRRAQATSDVAAALRAALSTPRVVVTPLGGPSVAPGRREVRLEGTDVAQVCSSAPADLGGPGCPVTAALVSAAGARARMAEEDAAALRASAGGLVAGREVSGDGWRVLRWLRSREAAEVAAARDFRVLRADGVQVGVAEAQEGARSDTR